MLMEFWNTTAIQNLNNSGGSWVENKITKATNLLESVISNARNWEDIASSDSLFRHVSGETQKLGGSFTGIGKNNTLTGTLLAMNMGDISNIIETFNTVLVMEMIEKDEIDEEQYDEAHDKIRDSLLSTELSRGYISLLTDARKSIKKEDYRSEVY